MDRQDGACAPDNHRILRLAGQKLRMGISGNMEYSAYLELGHEGRFAILWATVQANVQKIMDDSRKVVR